MQVLLLGMAAVLFLHDDFFAEGSSPGSPIDSSSSAEATGGGFWQLITHPAFVLPLLLAVKLIPLIVFALLAQRTRRTLGQPTGFRDLARLDRALGLLPAVLLALFAADIMLGWLGFVRQVVGDRVLLDEAIAMGPTLLVVLAAWFFHYPVDRRLREAAIMKRADEGLPVYPLLTRRGYVFQQARHQLAILLVPLLILMAWSESIDSLARAGTISFTAALWITPLGACTLFLFAPPLLTRVFDTVPLPAGSIRDALLETCRTHRIRVADLRLWRTGGHLVNAAVMGLVPRLRYVLLTDGLLDQLHRPHVEAVMAHELGHVKHRHLVWLVLFAGLLLGGSFALADAVIVRTTDAVWMQTLCVAAALVLWAYAFGWVSRRIERQADTFAAKHMSSPDNDSFTPEGVSHVVAALGRVAELNHLRPTRPSWRHGSIAKRQDYLLSLIDTPTREASVDRTMGRLKFVAVGAVLTLTALAFLDWVS